MEEEEEEEEDDAEAPRPAFVFSRPLGRLSAVSVIFFVVCDSQVEEPVSKRPRHAPCLHGSCCVYCSCRVRILGRIGEALLAKDTWTPTATLQLHPPTHQQWNWLRPATKFPSLFTFHLNLPTRHPSPFPPPFHPSSLRSGHGPPTTTPPPFAPTCASTSLPHHAALALSTATPPHVHAPEFRFFPAACAVPATGRKPPAAIAAIFQGGGMRLGRRGRKRKDASAGWRKGGRSAGRRSGRPRRRRRRKRR